MDILSIPVENRTHSLVRTIGEYYELISNGSIILDPVWQRAPRIEPGKEPAILASMILGDPICSFINKKEDGIVESSVDGGHRSRAIQNFINNQTSLPKNLDGEKVIINITGERKDISGKYFHELSTDIQHWFLDREISFTLIDENISAEQVGVYFRRANKNSKVSMMEMFNSYGNHPLARIIRNIVRSVDPEEKEKFHILFNFLDDKQKNNKMGWDELVLRILMYVIAIEDGHPWYSASKVEKEFEAAYNRFQNVTYETLKRKYHKLVMDCLDIIYGILNELTKQKRTKRAKTIIGSSTVNMKSMLKLVFVKFYLQRLYSKNIVDINSFAKFTTLIDELDELAHNDKETFVEKEKDITSSEKIRHNSDAWEDYPTKVGSASKSNYGNGSAEQYWESLLEKYLKQILRNKDIKDYGIVLKDSKRTFDQKDIAQKLKEQNYKCAISNVSVTIDEVDGDHIIPWSDGGSTTYDNLRAVKSDINRSSKRMKIFQ